MWCWLHVSCEKSEVSSLLACLLDCVRIRLRWLYGRPPLSALTHLATYTRGQLRVQPPSPRAQGRWLRKLLLE